MAKFLTEEWKEFYSKIQWRVVIFWSLLQIGFFYGIYLAVVYAKWQTILLSMILGHLTGVGMAVGSHRYFTHQSFKATLPLRVVLMILQTLIGQLSILDWVKSHQGHHKYTDTDGDHSNIKRGKFFSHIGWLMTEYHPECSKRREEIEVDHLERSVLIRFQHKYYFHLFFLVSILVPVLVSTYVFGETVKNAFYICFVFRYYYTFQVANFVSSWAHTDTAGSKPYDTASSAVHNQFLIYLGQGGAYHNYHHIFPWDYTASELGNKCFNPSTTFIDLCATIGCAYDLKRPSKQMIAARKAKTGDGSECTTTGRNVILDWIYGYIISSNIFLVLLLIKAYQNYYNDYYYGVLSI